MQEIRFLTLDPGHFHAALVQKEMYPQVSGQAHDADELKAGNKLLRQFPMPKSGWCESVIARSTALAGRLE